MTTIYIQGMCAYREIPRVCHENQNDLYENDYHEIQIAFYPDWNHEMQFWHEVQGLFRVDDPNVYVRIGMSLHDAGTNGFGKRCKYVYHDNVVYRWPAS